MQKTFFKIIIFSNFVLINNLDCMLKQITKSSFVTTFYKRAFSEESAVEKSVTTLKNALTQAGHTNFEIMIINRAEQFKLCASKFCLYPKHIIDPYATSVFKDDPKADCLCTRQTKLDTKEHVIQARLKKRWDIE